MKRSGIHVSRWLGPARVKRRVRQIDVAKAAGLSVWTVMRGEHGKHSIGERSAMAIARALGIPARRVVQLSRQRKAGSFHIGHQDKRQRVPRRVRMALREARLVQGMTTHEMAKAAGLSHQVAYDFEAGFATDRTVQAISRALGVQL